MWGRSILRETAARCRTPASPKADAKDSFVAEPVGKSTDSSDAGSADTDEGVLASRAGVSSGS